MIVELIQNPPAEAVLEAGAPEELLLTPAGTRGLQGLAGAMTIGTVTMVDAGDPATVVNVGTPQVAVLNFEIPGGAAATIEVGAVTTLEPGEDVTVENIGSTTAAILNIGIPAGDDGDDGAAATIAVGTVTTLSPGAPATVVNAGSSSAAVLNFGLPAGSPGDDGAAATIAIGTVTTLAAGEDATVVNSGTAQAAVLDFGIPASADDAALIFGSPTANRLATWSSSTALQDSGALLGVTNAGDVPTRAHADARYVRGPGAVTDNALVRYDGTTGLAVQNSAVTVTDTGEVLAGDAGGTGPSFAFANAPTYGMGRDTSTSRLRLWASGNLALSLSSSAAWIPNDLASLVMGVSADAILRRDAAGQIGQRNGTGNPQTFSVYNTYTDGSNYERGALAWSGNVLSVGAQAAGSGTLRQLQLVGSTIKLGATLDADGQTLTKVGVLEFGASLAKIAGPADGVIVLINSAGAGFGRLSFGGTTSSYPALKRSGTELQVRLADDSAYAPLRLSNLVVEGNLSVLGDTFTVDVGTLSVEDAIVELARNNSTGAAPYIGLKAERGSAGNDAYFVFDEANDRFLAALASSDALSDATLVEIRALLDAANLTGTMAIARLADASVTPAKLSATANPTGKQQLWISAAELLPRTTNGAQLVTTEISANKLMVEALAFDPSTVEYAQVIRRMPKGWNEGDFTFVPVWAHGDTTTNFGVTWKLAAAALSNAEALSGANLTTNSTPSADVGGSSYYVYQGPESAAATVHGSPSAEDLVVFQVWRDTADAGDTMAVDALLLGLAVFVSFDAANDA